MAAPARPTLPLTRRARLPRSGGPHGPSSRPAAAILERGAAAAALVPGPGPGPGIQRASRQRAARPYQTLLPACLPARSLARSHADFLVPSRSLFLTLFLRALSSRSLSFFIFLHRRVPLLPTYLPTCALGMRKTDLPSALIPRPALRAPRGPRVLLVPKVPEFRDARREKRPRKRAVS